MAENPITCFPDFFVQYDAQPFAYHVTEVQTAPTGREERRARLRSAGLRRWTFSSDLLNEANRALLRNFFNSQRGMLGAFYFWNPFPETLASFALGTGSGVTSVVVPIRGAWFGGAGGVSVAGSPKAATYANFTANGVGIVPASITPNIGTYGEDRANFSGAQSGPFVATVSGARERVVCRFDMDSMGGKFHGPTAQAMLEFPITIKELVP
jgi:hypothetical protein